MTIFARVIENFLFTHFTRCITQQINQNKQIKHTVFLDISLYSSDIIKHEKIIIQWFTNQSTFKKNWIPSKRWSILMRRVQNVCGIQCENDYFSSKNIKKYQNYLAMGGSVVFFIHSITLQGLLEIIWSIKPREMSHASWI